MTAPADEGMAYLAVQNFRHRHRAQVGPRCSAWLHGGFAFGLGISAFVYMLACVGQTQAWHWLAASLGLLVFNAGVCLVHRELGHHKRNWAALSALFCARHTGDHHSLSSKHAMSHDAWRDWRDWCFILFLSWLIVVFFVAFVAPAIWLCSQFIDAPFA